MDNNISKCILQFMKGRIPRLCHSKAALAQLRRGIGKELGELPALLAFVLPEEELSSWQEGEEMAEKAIYTAITLYAFHQQGSESCVSAGIEEKDMSVSHRNSFGHAMWRLSQKREQDEGILRRFRQVVTAKDITELSVHARGLIGMLRQEGISLDYSSFAVDLYWFQQADTRRRTLLQWGKDYYVKKQREEDTK